MLFFVKPNLRKQLDIGKIAFVQATNWAHFHFLQPVIVISNYTERGSEKNHKALARATDFNINTYYADLAQRASKMLPEIIKKDPQKAIVAKRHPIKHNGVKRPNKPQK